MKSIKADFHLHTYHSDNRDRMTVDEYARRARDLGYGALGFCDHHHNLTQQAWATLRDEVAAATRLDGAPLLTTGYEATYMTGHLCVLARQRFDGESIADCARQMWSPTNTRILAHPDNNICDWRMLLPIGVQGVEVINGGQDPYSVRRSSFCNGLATFQRYLFLNHPVAPIAQSDCHERAVFGRVWTELLLPDDEPVTWPALRASLERGHTTAVMGGLSLRLWTEEGALYWEVPPGAQVTLFLADRPLAHFAPGEAHSYTIRANGPHWLLAQRGLAWAVSSPIWVRNQPVEVHARRAGLQAHPVVQHARDALLRRLDWLHTLEAWWSRTAYPVAAYDAWLTALLPEHWAASDASFSGHGDPFDWAMLRLEAAQSMADALLAELCRVQAQTEAAAPTSPAVPRLLVTLPGRLAAGVYSGTVETPRSWESVHLTTAGQQAGQELRSMAFPIAGERDPLHGPRSREQMRELVVWLARGEIHEYLLRDPQLTVNEARAALLADLWPAVLDNGPTPRPDLAAELQRLIDSPQIAHFHVHLRMPRRFALAFALDNAPDNAPVSDTCVLDVLEGTGQLSTRLLELDWRAPDLMADALVVQFR